MRGEGTIFDRYLHSNQSNRGFYERWKQGEKLNTGWVNPSDFESDVVE
jgi:hypothetical protein